jgi:hypothetical protein
MLGGRLVMNVTTRRYRHANGFVPENRPEPADASFNDPVLGTSPALPGWGPAGRLPRVRLPEMVIRLWSRLEHHRIHHHTDLIMLGG